MVGGESARRHRKTRVGKNWRGWAKSTHRNHRAEANENTRKIMGQRKTYKPNKRERERERENQGQKDRRDKQR